MPVASPRRVMPVALEPVDGGVQREREEDRDQDPGEDLARDPDDLEQQATPRS